MGLLGFLLTLTQIRVALITPPNQAGALISVKTRSLNARFYVSNKFILNSSNLIFKLGQWQVEVESTGRMVKRLKSEAYF